MPPASVGAGVILWRGVAGAQQWILGTEMMGELQLIKIW